MTLETILYEVAEQVALITMNRPEKRNAQSMRMIAELDEVFSKADHDPAVRVVVLRGAGPSFSAGHDMSWWGSTSVPPDFARFDVLRRTAEGRLELEREMFFDKCLAIRNRNKPSIAQVHGHCIAAGMMLAAMCDIIYASEDTTFSNPVLRMAASSVEVLFEPWDFGPRRAKELLFTAEPIAVNDAFRLGFVNKVVQRDCLEAEVLALARKIALTPPVAVSLTKRSINRTMDIMGQADAWEHHFLVHQLSHSTAEAAEFNESRQKAPDLKGQFRSINRGLRP